MFATGELEKKIQNAVKAWYGASDEKRAQYNAFVARHRSSQEFKLLVSSKWFVKAVMSRHRDMAFRQMSALDVKGRVSAKLCLDALQESERTPSLLGEGAYGSVFRHPSKPGRVLKVVDNKNVDYSYVLREVEITRAASDLGVAPRFHNAYTCCGDNYECLVMIEMDAVDQTLYEWLDKPRPEKQMRAVLESLKRLLSTLHSNGIVHHDIHLGNVMLDKKNRVFVVDYGRANMAEGRALANYPEEITREGAEWLHDLLSDPSSTAANANTSLEQFVAAAVVAGLPV